MEGGKPCRVQGPEGKHELCFPAGLGANHPRNCAAPSSQEQKLDLPLQLDGIVIFALQPIDEGSWKSETTDALLEHRT